MFDSGSEENKQHNSWEVKHIFRFLGFQKSLLLSATVRCKELLLIFFHQFERSHFMISPTDFKGDSLQRRAAVWP